MGEVIRGLQDMTWLEWGLSRTSPGTVGTFLKSGFFDGNQNKIYCKLSAFDSDKGTVGHESINELIADRLFTLLGVEHLSYTLVHANVSVYSHTWETWFVESKDFKAAGEDKIELENYYKANRYSGEDIIAFCQRMGWSKYLWEMLVCDFLIQNRDRHGANIEVLRDRRTGKVRLAPIFDNGLSLLFSCHSKDAAETFDIKQERRVQSITEKNYTIENLELIPKDELPTFNALKESDREYLIEDLDEAVPKEFLDKIWDMVWYRWRYYEDFRTKR